MIKMEKDILNADEERPKCVHLFNCDKTYNLGTVEKLLLDIKDDIKRKLNFDIKLPIVQNYFRLSNMSEMCETIPKLQMDLAFFVVHAHESRLSINEDNAGIGYAKIYRALLRATDKNVIVIIGGDDSYKNKNEEESSVISRWARRKISSQFQQEYLDGRKSFIFSWNKKHRAIHEEALLHYFDPNKKGQKFDYQPKDHTTVPPRKQTCEKETQMTIVDDHFASDKDEAMDEIPAIPGQSGQSKQGNDAETCETEKTYDMISLDEAKNEIPAISGQSGQSKQENETETTWEMISLDEAKNVICQQPQTSSTEGNSKDGTLVMKLRMRYGSISFKEEDAVLNEKWRPPEELLMELSEKWVNVAEAELEIYHMEEKGAIRVEIKDTSQNSLFPAMVVNVFNAFFRFCLRGSETEPPIDWPDSDSG